MADTSDIATSDQWSARICRLAETDDLETMWKSLEATSECTFFLSWPWIDTWLSQQADNPWVVLVEKGRKPIGIGLFCESTETRHKILRKNQICLNSTGDRERDAITIEFNTFICDKSRELDVWKTALTALRSSATPKWDEILVKGATDELCAQLRHCGLITHLRAKAGSAKIDLNQLRANGIVGVDGFVSTLSKNTRSQIRRSIRLYEERGPITLTRANDAYEAWAFLQEGAPHHSKRWEEKGGGKAFEREEYVEFHKALIDKYYETGVLEVVRVSAGDRPFAWIYNFVDRGHVYFYLGSLVFEDDNRLKPGLVAHAYCAAQHLEDGAVTYDFMGGDNRYKISLGAPGAAIVSFALLRPTLTARIEDRLRQLKRKFGR